MKNVTLTFLTLICLWTSALASPSLPVGGCDYANEEWLTNILSDPDLCNSCIGEINAYILNDTIYIGVIEDNVNCTDGLTTIYYCDGTQFCLEGGFAGFQQCNEWWAQGPQQIETLWARSLDCDCVCPAIFDPVCGSNGITYSNACFAECDNEFDYVSGECDSDAFTCDWEDLIWLDSILQTEDLCNFCIESVQVYELRDTTFIAFIADDMNCADALTTVFTCDFEVYCLNGGFGGFTQCEDFFNDPDLALQATIWTLEENCNCNCIEIYQPVCGSDGITYDNSCFAECAGITDYTDGECDPNSVEDLVYADWQIQSIAPNPTTDIVHISLASVEKSLALDLYNTLGVLLEKIEIGQHQGSTELHLDMSDWASGLYFLVFKTETEQGSVRVVKQ